MGFLVILAMALAFNSHKFLGVDPARTIASKAGGCKTAFTQKDKAIIDFLAENFHRGEPIFEALIEKASDRVATNFLIHQAKEGELFSQSLLGLYYARGERGFKQNNTAAKKWLRASTDMVSSIIHLIDVLSTGRSNNNNKELLRLYDKLHSVPAVTRAFTERAADQIKAEAKNGNAHAQYFMGSFYEHGAYGFKQNYREAFDWYSKADKNGDVMATTKIVEFLEVGLGVRQNKKRAKEIKKELEKYVTLKIKLKKGEQPTKSLLESTLRKIAREHLISRAESGETFSQALLGQSYLQGERGFNKNTRSADKWLTKAADKGLIISMIPLAIYGYGNPLSVSSSAQRVAMYRKIFNTNVMDKVIEEVILDQIKAQAERGNAHAEYFMGSMFEYGTYGTKENNKEALKWYTKAAKGGDVKAATKVIDFLENGRKDVKKNLRRAREYKRETAEDIKKQAHEL